MKNPLYDLNAPYLYVVKKNFTEVIISPASLKRKKKSRHQKRCSSVMSRKKGKLKIATSQPISEYEHTHTQSLTNSVTLSTNYFAKMITMSSHNVYWRPNSVTNDVHSDTLAIGTVCLP